MFKCITLCTSVSERIAVDTASDQQYILSTASPSCHILYILFDQIIHNLYICNGSLLANCGISFFL